MKKIILTLVFTMVSIFSFTSCSPVHNQSSTNESDYDSVLVKELDYDECFEIKQTNNVKYKYNICNLRDSIFKLYPNIGKNDIQTNKACTYAFMEFTTKFNYYINEIPMQFQMMQQYNKSKYIVKFEAGEHTTNDKQLQTGNNKISLCIFGYVTEDVAESLVENKKYYISGTNITPYLNLRSGNTYTQSVNYHEYGQISGAPEKSLDFSCVVKDMKITNI